MCVILICPPGVRPDGDVVEACHAANPHGAGVAWREGKEVRWSKNLDPAGVMDALRTAKGEAVVHFRWASVGGVNPRLCHPFPVDRAAATKLEGAARRVLFHNGTWAGYRDALAHIEQKQKRTIAGAISDSRVMALLVDHLRKPEVLGDVEGRWVLFSSRETRVFGDWREWRGMRCSNLGFLYEMDRAKRPCRKAARAGAEPQMALWEEGGAR
jgi:hypothetical protein